jgi:hypothetical protein
MAMLSSMPMVAAVVVQLEDPAARRDEELQAEQRARRAIGMQRIDGPRQQSARQPASDGAFVARREHVARQLESAHVSVFEVVGGHEHDLTHGAVVERGERGRRVGIECHSRPHALRRTGLLRCRERAHVGFGLAGERARRARQQAR